MKRHCMVVVSERVADIDRWVGWIWTRHYQWNANIAIRSGLGLLISKTWDHYHNAWDWTSAHLCIFSTDGVQVMFVTSADHRRYLLEVDDHPFEQHNWECITNASIPSIWHNSKTSVFGILSSHYLNENLKLHKTVVTEELMCLLVRTNWLNVYQTVVLCEMHWIISCSIYWVEKCGW